MLQKEELASLLNEMSQLIDSPHAICAVSLDGSEKFHYGSKIADATPIQLIIFALNLLYIVTDEHVVDDEIVRAIDQLRKYVGRFSIKVGPAKDDETT